MGKLLPRWSVTRACPYRYSLSVISYYFPVSLWLCKLSVQKYSFRFLVSNRIAFPIGEFENITDLSHLLSGRYNRAMNSDSRSRTAWRKEKL